MQNVNAPACVIPSLSVGISTWRLVWEIENDDTTDCYESYSTYTTNAVGQIAELLFKSVSPTQLNCLSQIGRAMLRVIYISLVTQGHWSIPIYRIALASRGNKWSQWYGKMRLIRVLYRNSSGECHQFDMVRWHSIYNTWRHTVDNTQ